MISFKDIRGNWAAKRGVDLQNGHLLIIYTAKRSNGMTTTTVQAHKIEGRNLVFTAKSFSKQVNSSNKPCTQKLVEALVFPDNEDKIIEAAKQHYL